MCKINMHTIFEKMLIFKKLKLNLVNITKLNIPKRNLVISKSVERSLELQNGVYQTKI